MDIQPFGNGGFALQILCKLSVYFVYKQNIRDDRDLLLIDNDFLAETELVPTSWGPIRAKATQDEKLLSGARDYIHMLVGARKEECTYRMKDEAIKRYFPSYKGLSAGGSGTLADKLFQQTIASVSK